MRMLQVFINGVKGIELPDLFKNVHAEYCTEEEIQEYPESADFVQYWADIDESDTEKAETFCRENNFDFWY